MNRIRKAVLALVVITLFAGASPIRAQDDPDAINIRASHLIDSTMASLNIRAQRFNEELAKINALKPLEVSSLAKDVIPKNREKIKDFLSYLDLYRSLSSKMKQAIEDSVMTLRMKMPKSHREKYLQDFLDAYSLDQTAFDKYTLALTKVFTNVDAVLAFLETSNVKIDDGKLQFSSQTELDKYSKLDKLVMESNKKLITASANSQKANIDASTMMQKAYGAVKR
ncbi:MAG: hypothetical protein Q8896_10080 [Bacteroidota bacterium]|nr:hypothetical protein [Bacteroidota bacterium]MDP4237696.1 hypothetical protein [Bacteroidota bacterium]